jgi:hypothetical protein
MGGNESTVKLRTSEQDDRHSPRGSLRLWISLAVVFFILFMIGLGQWDFAVAGFIGLVLGNGLQALFSR